VSTVIVIEGAEEEQLVSRIKTRECAEFVFREIQSFNKSLTDP